MKLSIVLVMAITGLVTVMGHASAPQSLNEAVESFKQAAAVADKFIICDETGESGHGSCRFEFSWLDIYPYFSALNAIDKYASENPTAENCKKFRHIVGDALIRETRQRALAATDPLGYKGYGEGNSFALAYSIDRSIVTHLKNACLKK